MCYNRFSRDYMTLQELMPQLKQLSHDEKILAIEFLNVELQEEQINSIFTATEYTIYTQFGMEALREYWKLS